MNLQWLKSYVIVIDEGGVTAAARKMYISPQALLQQINLFEKEVGFQLLNRTSAGMTPTEAGAAFYQECQQLLKSWASALEECRAIASHASVLRIPVMSSIMSPDSTETICTRYRQLSPTGPEIRYINTSKPNDTWIDDLIEDRFDIIKWYKPVDYALDNIYFEKMADVYTACICRTDHPMAEYAELHISDLANQHIGIISTSLFENLRKQIDAMGETSVFESVASDRYSIVSACERGCICLTDTRIASSFRSLGYRAIPLAAESGIEVGFACKQEKTAAYALFFEAVRQERDLLNNAG